MGTCAEVGACVGVVALVLLLLSVVLVNVEII